MARKADEEEAAAALNMFAEFLECPQQLLGAHMSSVLSWAMHIAADTSQPLEVRAAAVQVPVDCLLEGFRLEACFVSNAVQLLLKAPMATDQDTYLVVHLFVSLLTWGLGVRIALAG